MIEIHLLIQISLDGFYEQLIFYSNCRKKWATVGKDVVVLHQIGRGRITPCASPFPLKLETYLRITGIPYEVKLL